MSREKILEVKDLTVSFKTPNGLVRAVRSVSFDLHKGETLAIVGESGSGKSVTNRAIMGILAGNAVIDKGEINYRNQDLTKLSEENFHKIRGNKIGMIFQDPLSSLNPIMRIGKQITEAMLVNGDVVKNRYRDLYHHEYHDYLNLVTRINILKSEVDYKKIEFNTNEELSKAEKKEQFAAYKVKNHALIAELKLGLPALKATYKAAQKKAKETTDAEVKAVKIEKVEPIAKAKILSMETVQKVKDERVIAIASARKNLIEAKAAGDSTAAQQELKRVKKEYRQKLQDAKDIYGDVVESYKRRFKVTRRQAHEKAIEVMTEVGIPEPKKRFRQYPFQFSGGMRQRIVIAIALTADPELLICDEPTTALDVTIQGQILGLISDLKKTRDLSVIFITHDLGVVANVADRVAVMYAGKIVEYGTSEEIFYEPKHPYTWALLSSVPDLETTDKLLSIPGTPPDMLFPPRGDAFAERNQFAMRIDFEEKPPFFKVSDTHYAATWLLHPDAPKDVKIPKIIGERIKRYHEISDERTKESNEGDLDE